jgi:hypothetical protein
MAAHMCFCLVMCVYACVCVLRWGPWWCLGRDVVNYGTCSTLPLPLSCLMVETPSQHVFTCEVQLIDDFPNCQFIVTAHFPRVNLCHLLGATYNCPFYSYARTMGVICNSLPLLSLCCTPSQYFWTHSLFRQCREVTWEGRTIVVAGASRQGS